MTCGADPLVGLRNFLFVEKPGEGAVVTVKPVVTHCQFRYTLKTNRCFLEELAMQPLRSLILTLAVTLTLSTAIAQTGSIQGALVSGKALYPALQVTERQRVK